MQVGYKTGKEEHIAPLQKMVGPMAPRGYHTDYRFTAWHLVLVAVLSAVGATVGLPFLQDVLQRMLHT
jgi:hypothetical protein